MAFSHPTHAIVPVTDDQLGLGGNEPEILFRDAAGGTQTDARLFYANLTDSLTTGTNIDQRGSGGAMLLQRDGASVLGSLSSDAGAVKLESIIGDAVELAPLQTKTVTVTTTGIIVGSGVTDYALPVTRGADGQVLQTDAAGNVTWQKGGSSSVGTGLQAGDDEGGFVELVGSSASGSDLTLGGDVTLSKVGAVFTFGAESTFTDAAGTLGRIVQLSNQDGFEVTTGGQSQFRGRTSTHTDRELKFQMFSDGHCYFGTAGLDNSTITSDLIIRTTPGGGGTNNGNIIFRPENTLCCTMDGANATFAGDVTQSGGTLDVNGPATAGDVPLTVNANAAIDDATPILEVQKAGTSVATFEAGGDLRISNGELDLRTSNRSMILRKDGFNHPFSGRGDTDIAAVFDIDATDGQGLFWYCYSENGNINSAAFWVQAHVGSNTPNVEPIRFEGYKFDGGNNRMALAATDRFVNFRNNAIDQLMIYGDGTIVSQGRLIFPNLPTGTGSPPGGLASGALWVDTAADRTVKQVA